MEWWVTLLALLGGLMLLLFLGIPVAFSFVLLTGAAMYGLMGTRAPQLLVNSILDSLTQFTLTPIPLFVLMGSLLFRSGIVRDCLTVLDRYVGNVPGRLLVVTLLAGTLFGSMSGSTLAMTATLTGMLVPEMLRMGYDKRMIAGSVMAAGTLDFLIPPNTLTIVLGSLAKISVGDLLIAGIGPGLLLSALYILYVVVASVRIRQRSPADRPDPVALAGRPGHRQLLGAVIPILAVGGLSIGTIWAGWATPTEAASLGALGALVVAASRGRLRRHVVVGSLLDTARITGMILAIVAGSMGFSQVLAFSGATRQLLAWVASLPVPPTVILAGMLGVILFLGMFLEELAIIMITVPVFFPIANALGFQPIWFGVLVLMALMVSLITPPVGMLLYVAKGALPRGFTMRDVWTGAMPFCALALLATILVFLFPGLPLAMTRSLGH